MGINIEHFVNSYIRFSFNLIGPGIHLDLNKYHEVVFKRVSERMGISVDDVKYLHHPLFLSLFAKESSPFKIVYYGTEINPKTEVTRSRNLWWRYEGYTGDFAKRIINENKDWFESRTKKIPLPKNFFNKFGP